MSDRAASKRVTTTKQAIDSFLMSCKVEGKSYGTIECYTDKLKGFLWYASTHKWPKDIKAVTADHLKLKQESRALNVQRGHSWFNLLFVVSHGNEGRTRPLL